MSTLKCFAIFSVLLCGRWGRTLLKCYNQNLDRAAWSAMTIRLSWSCRILAGTAGVMGPVRLRWRASAFPGPVTKSRASLAFRMGRIPRV